MCSNYHWRYLSYLLKNIILILIVRRSFKNLAIHSLPRFFHHCVLKISTNINQTSYQRPVPRPAPFGPNHLPEFQFRQYRNRFMILLMKWLARKHFRHGFSVFIEFECTVAYFVQTILLKVFVKPH